MRKIFLIFWNLCGFFFAVLKRSIKLTLGGLFVAARDVHAGSWGARVVREERAIVGGYDELVKKLAD